MNLYRKVTYTARDYLSASQQRMRDLHHLGTSDDSDIMTLYCAGVAIESILRAHILLHTKEFSSRHDIEKLWEDSRLRSKITIKEMEVCMQHLNYAKNYWSNDLRYASASYLKRKIGHEEALERARSHSVMLGDIKQKIKQRSKRLLQAAEFIVQIGVEKWK